MWKNSTTWNLSWRDSSTIEADLKKENEKRTRRRRKDKIWIKRRRRRRSGEEEDLEMENASDLEHQRRRS